METKVIKRRGGGRPNRGGGRFNRGRGGRGRGRGGSVPQQTPGSGAKQKGHGGRKGGADLYMYDDCYDDEDDDADEPRRGPNSQASSASMSYSQSQSRSQDQSSLGGRGQHTQRAGQYPPGRERVKVTMQHLNMTAENQEMVREMLKDLQGKDIELGREEDYDELDYRSENQYWMTDNILKIEEATAYEDQQETEDDHTDMTVSTLAVNKLTRYGFDKGRSRDALQVCDGDIGLALEFLLSEAFSLKLLTEVEDQDGIDCLSEEFLEQRLDEKVALQSIFEDRFTERIENRVWILKFNLPYLETITLPPKRERKKVEIPDRNVCKYFKQGDCRFGSKCKFKHPVIQPDVEEHETESDANFDVEIRFPPGNKYPHEPPYIAVSTTSRVSRHVCLSITQHMIREAKLLADLQEPSVFSVINCLEDDSFLDEIVKQPPHEFSDPPSDKPWHRQKQASYNEDTGMFNLTKDKKETVDCDTDELSEQTGAMLRMVEKEIELKSERKQPEETGEAVPVKRSTSRENDIVKTISPAEILKQNRRLIDEYKRKKTYKSYQNMQTDRHRLPAWNMQDEILRMIEGNQVLVISGMTGCGKTTQVPQYILDLYLESGDLHLCNILCTQPRRISAMAVAERVAEERADRLGRLVGYQIRLEKVQSSMTRLLFCTTGIVLRRLEGDSTLDGVTHLIIDEVHERSEESDFLLMYLRDMLPQRPDLKVILMSATLNAELFCNYFNNCPAVDIPGKTFPVEQYFLEDAVEFTRFIMDESSTYARPLKYMNAVRQELMPYEQNEAEEEGTGPSHPASDKIHDQNLSVRQLFMRYPDYRKQTVRSMARMDHTKINFDLVLQLLEWLVTENHEDLNFPTDGAVLLFMPGYAEIQTLFDMLRTSPVFGHRNKHRFKIIPLHSTLSSEDQHAVFAKPPEGVTKIVIATNIAETSITIDDVVFVIDAGKMKEKRYDPTKGMESLDMVWVSKANALQRKGRAGRVKPGVCFHLFTSHRYEHHLQQQPVPEIQRAPLEQVVLRIKMLDIFKTTAVETVLNMLPEPPDQSAITSAVKRLQDLGALDERGELTPLGYHVGSLPVDVRIGKLMLFGAIFRCLDSALTIAACLSFKSPFVTPFGKKAEATQKKLDFAAGNSDHLTMYRAYRAWMEARKRGSQAGFYFCQDNFLSQRTLEMLSSMKQQFVELLSDIGFVKEGISARDVERAARAGFDGVTTVTGEEANMNSENWKLVSAILVGALFPNIVQVLTPESKYAHSSGGSVPKAPKAEDLRFKTKPDGYVKIHPSSVNFQVRYYESPYLVYHEKVKTTKIFIRDCTMVSVYPLLLFGGANIAVDLSRGNFILSVDEGWIRFQAGSHEIAELVRELRLELDNLLSDKIKSPHMDLSTCPRGSRIIATIVKLVSTQ